METKKKFEAFWREFATPISVIIVGVLIAASIYTAPWQRAPQNPAEAQSKLELSVLPSDGYALPITWGDLGAKLVEVGAIDPAKMA
ncbi:MAG: hypothetical protein Q8P17_04600, partial [bacterium]|nr:hypothetical protein [bacterium]